MAALAEARLGSGAGPRGFLSRSGAVLGLDKDPAMMTLNDEAS